MGFRVEDSYRLSVLHWCFLAFNLENNICHYIQMVAGSIEERIKKMKEAILNEAKERAATIVKNADE